MIILFSSNVAISFIFIQYFCDIEIHGWSNAFFKTEMQCEMSLHTKHWLQVYYPTSGNKTFQNIPRVFFLWPFENWHQDVTYGVRNFAW